MKHLLTCLISLLWVSLTYSQVQKEIIYVDADIELHSLSENVFIHTTWSTSEGYGRFPSNGLVITDQGQGILVDTPIDEDLTKRLLDYLRDSMSINIKTLIINHFHNDCMGGIGYTNHLGIQSIASNKTIEKCKEEGLPIPVVGFEDSMVVSLAKQQVLCWYPGGGHTVDNIVVWLPQERILFAGCMAKSMNSNNLGNIEDADLTAWPLTLHKVLQRFPSAGVVVPGHGRPGDISLIHHTLRLLKP